MQLQRVRPNDDGTCEFLSRALCWAALLDGACNFNPEANINDGSCEYLSCQGCLNPSACNYDDTATIAGICDYTSCVGCTDPAADNYDATATIEGSCDYLGCTSFTACNYDPNANVNDGSCEFLSCVGCLNSLACNYDEDATQSGSCIFPTTGFNCDGTCVDTDMDGVCDVDEVLGCTDETALNYNPDATEDAGNCVLPVGGCTDPSACNYDAAANTNDGSCDYESCFGCLNVVACNYDENALYPDASQCDFETCYGCDRSHGLQLRRHGVVRRRFMRLPLLRRLHQRPWRATTMPTPPSTTEILRPRCLLRLHRRFVE